MSEILQDLSAPALVNAIDESGFAFFANLSSSPHFEVHVDPDMLWALTDVSDWPMFNSILCARLDPESMVAAIETAIARGRSRNVPIAWWIGPTTSPTDLGQHLASHGFARIGDMAGMAVDLRAVKPIPSSPPDVTITEVQDTESLKTWCHVSAVGFGMPDSANSVWLDTFTSIGLGPAVPFRHYLGWWEGEPVAASSLLLGAGVAGIYNVATLPSARRRGIGTAVTFAPLRKAQAMGYRVSVLQSSQMAYSVYRRLGFQEYCKIDLYLWATEPSG